jgi:hypothetical protein
MDITKIIEALRLSTGQLFTLFLILTLSAGTLLFGPDTILELMGVAEIPKPYNILPGITFIVSLVGTLVTSTVYISLKVGRIINRLQSRKRREKRLQRLLRPSE